MNHSIHKILPVLALLSMLIVTPAPAAMAQSAITAETPRVSLLVELATPSAAAVYIAQMAGAAAQSGDAVPAEVRAAATTAAQAQLATITAEQSTLAAALQTLGVQELYRAQRVYNAIAVRATADQVEALQSLPGVRSVTPISMKMPDNAVSVPLIGAPALWGGSWSLPLTGKGVRIGIIDTGIDYIHTDFGGSGSDDEYAANDSTRIDDITAFPNAKVVGGYDIVGNFYAAGASNDEAVAIEPDPDPFDCYGHGTHVAGTAAGYGVTATGATFRGPYNATTPFAKLRIGPGVAPMADIYSIKVFGCYGGSDFVDKGIEWAVDPNGDGDFSDHMDIINLSLGSAFGDSTDSSSIAIDNAAQLGVIAVISAGNNGDVHYVSGSPGSSTYAITVAATGASANILGPFSTTPKDALAAFSSRGPRHDNMLKPDIAAPGDDIVSADSGSGSEALTASGTSMAAPHVSGAMALMRELHPTWRVEELKALLMNTAMADVRLLQYNDNVQASPTRAGAGRVELQSAARSSVIAYNADVPGSVSISFGAPDVLVSYTALHNVRLRNSSSTPQKYSMEYVSATDMPGVNVIPPAEVTVPAHGIAVAAVRLEATAAQMQNTPPSLVPVDRSPLDAWQTEETGLLWMWPSPATFSAKSGAETASPSSTFTLDVPSKALAYDIAPIKPSTNTTVTYSLQRGAVDDLANASAITLYTHAAGTPVEPSISGSVVLSARDKARLTGGELSLRIDVGDGSAPPTIKGIVADVPVLKLPVYAAPRPVADMHAGLPVLDFGTVAPGPAVTKALPLTGTTLSYGETPTTTMPLLSVFELHARSTRVSEFGLASVPPSIDIQYVGVTSDYLTVPDKDDARIFFAVVTYGPWSTPHEVTFEFDVNVSGPPFVLPYRTVVNTTTGMVMPFGNFDDTFIAGIIEDGYFVSIKGDPLNVYRPADVQTAIFNNNVMILSVLARDLGLSAETPAFTFSLTSSPRAREWGFLGDSVQGMSYNMAKPGLNLTNGQWGSPIFADSPATKLQVGFRLVPYGTSSAQGILLMHHHNAGEVRAEVVGINYHWPTEIRLPIMRFTNP